MTTGHLHARADSERHLSFVYCQGSEARGMKSQCALRSHPGDREPHQDEVDDGEDEEQAALPLVA
jgi:hypothetical protein